MALTLAGTDVLIDYLAGALPAADIVAEEIENGTLAATTLARFELLSAASAGKQEMQVRQLLLGILLLPFDEAVADRAVELRRTLAGEGRVLSHAACLTAATAIVHSARLLTADRAAWEGIPNLRLWSFPL